MNPDDNPIDLRGSTIVNIGNNRRRRLKEQAEKDAKNDSVKDIWDYLDGYRSFRVGKKKRKLKLYDDVYRSNIPQSIIDDYNEKNKVYNEYKSGNYLNEVDRELSNFSNEPLEEVYSKNQRNNERKYRKALYKEFSDSSIVKAFLYNLADETRFNGDAQQKGGTATGYFQMEPGTRKKYIKQLRNDESSFEKEVQFIKGLIENSDITNKLYLIDDPSFKDDKGKSLQAWNDEDVLKSIGIIDGYGDMPADSTFYKSMKQHLGDSLAFRKNAIVESRNLRRKYEDKYDSGKARSTTYRYVGLPLSSALGILNNADNLTDKQAAFLFNIGFERAGRPHEQLRYSGYKFK